MSNMNKVYLAGGCFWGIEHLMSSIKEVSSAISGYANGTDLSRANYNEVSKGDTNFKETVEVSYDSSIVSLEFLLSAYFYVVHPEQRNRQGNDIGSQYQAGIYYIDDKSKEVIKKYLELEKRRYQKFFIEFSKLENFVAAEEYHQKYLDKNPQGYCHIPKEAIDLFANSKIDPSKYVRPENEKIKEELDKVSYEVTQNNGTERPFTSKYYDFNKLGIYVDIVTGEPLFSSSDKYLSSCGWPSFSKPLEETVVIKKEDDSHQMIRTEVRSRKGDSHLGHVFLNDLESPNGVRYCINGASLRFIPLEEMEKEGYGDLIELIK